MPLDENAPRPDAPTAAPGTPPDAPSLSPAAAPAPAGRRRRNRSWSSPPGTPTESFERPLTERDWSRGPAPAASTPPPTPTAPPAPGRVPIAAPPPAGASSPAAAGGTGSAGPEVLAILAALQSEVAALRQEVAAQAAEAGTRGTTLVTGAELAASIDALGTTLGTGLATLLTEHRNLLARDVESAADRILEELGQRLRTSATQTVDGVEERVRHISAKSIGDLSDQLDLRLDQVEADVSGLRAVILEIPDQTQVVERLDQLVGGDTPAPRRRSPLRPEAAPADDGWDEIADDDEDEPAIPVTRPARRAPKAPLRATPEPKAKRAPKAPPAATVDEDEDEPAPAPARAPRAPRTARAAGISADVEAAKRAGRRGKR